MDTRLMLKYILIFLLSSNLYSVEIIGKVVGVTDGDTIKVLDANKTLYKVRLYGIDAPEKKQPYGQKAKEYLSSLVFEQEVKLIIVNKDRYGRVVAKVYLLAGDFCGKKVYDDMVAANEEVNLEMVKAGYAWVYRQYIKWPDSYLWGEDELEAKKLRLGLWQDKNPIEPWNYRKSKKPKLTVIF